MSRSAGEAYADKLFLLPTFLIGGVVPPTLADMEEALRMTGYFLATLCLAPRGLVLPDAARAFSPRCGGQGWRLGSQRPQPGPGAGPPMPPW